ncbi:ATP-binding protein [Streptomyces sp. NPDC008150]|uniref:ATP-binding protein n=1 Tax=Streptomyces sp. NPDC008150 TaxID=3364816 RepID=UPI0036EBABA6
MKARPGDQSGSPTDGAPEVTFTLRDNAAISEARHRAAGFLARLHETHGITVPSPAVEITLLVVSELVTNARKYAPGLVLLHLRVVDRTVQVTVWDTAPDMPQVSAADPRRIGRHGLEIVKALVQRFEIRPEGMGKRITGHIAMA